MLVLSRKVGERILIGDKICVTVVRIGQGGVRIGIEAPNELEVIREELKGNQPAPGRVSAEPEKSPIGAPR
jgi:carbon storage regulator